MSEWIYRQLLRLYPAAYLRDYREPMEQAFRDQMRDARSGFQRVELALAAFIDTARSALPLHRDLQTGVLSMGSLFVAMSGVICVTAWLTPNRLLLESVAGLFAFYLGYLDPIRERSYWEPATNFRRWSLRLSFVMLLAAEFISAAPATYRQPNLIVLVWAMGRLGARLRCRLSPEFDGLGDVDLRDPAVMSLDLNRDQK